MLNFSHFQNLILAVHSLMNYLFFLLCFLIGTVLRPGFIHGTRQVGSIKLPLSLIGAPLEMVNEDFAYHSSLYRSGTTSNERKPESLLFSHYRFCSCSRNK